MKWIKIKEIGIEITNEQQYNGFTYSQILEKVKETENATYELLQKLRNTGNYDFLKEFWVFVPNPDLASKKNYVAGFVAYSNRADLYCGRDPSDSGSSLGVFLIRKIKGEEK